MIRTFVAPAVLSLMVAGTFAACGEGSTLAPEASCIAVVNVGGILYGPSSAPAVDPVDLSGDPYVVVTRNTGCLDEVQGRTGPLGGKLEPPGGGGGVTTGSTLAPGESNFLPEGSELYAISGFEPAERLAYWASVVGEWRVLEPWESAD